MEVKCEDLICSRDEIQADGRIVTTPQIYPAIRRVDLK